MGGRKRRSGTVWGANVMGGGEERDWGGGGGISGQQEAAGGGTTLLFVPLPPGKGSCWAHTLAAHRRTLTLFDIRVVSPCCCLPLLASSLLSVSLLSSEVFLFSGHATPNSFLLHSYSSFVPLSPFSSCWCFLVSSCFLSAVFILSYFLSFVVPISS